MSRFSRAFVLLACAGVLTAGAWKYSFAGEEAAPRIKEYTPNISSQEYEKRYNAVYGKSTEKMAEEGNPADFMLDDGKDLFGKAEGSAGKSCASCHGANGEKLKGVAATFPKYDPAINGINTVALQINRCRQEHMGAAPLKYETYDQLALELYVKSLSNGVPIKVSIDGPAKPFYEAGKAYYYKRHGQFNFSCAICHVKYAGHMMRANLLSSNRHHADHWPAYRLDWGAAGSFQKRFRGCNKNVRQEVLPFQCETYRDLELYLTYQANGLPIQVPGFKM
ncbi:MAG: sulfur oxidation c-type cytochrome SoxA [Nitrospiraceae bacterium]|nr:sulfur oxidation c-type cytochrome SoxA [Nitrospiraceae bacterium]